MSDIEYSAHPNALIEAGATIGSGTRIWAFAHVQAKAVIGRNCNIGDYAFVESGARLGDDVTVKNGVQIWEGVTAENGVFFGPNCVLTNDMHPRAFLERPKDDWLQTTRICEGATIGAGAIIVCGNTIGRFAFVAAGALVTRDVPAFAMVLGRPAQFQYWISRAVERLDFRDGIEARCPKSNRLYRLENEQVVELSE